MYALYNIHMYAMYDLTHSHEKHDWLDTFTCMGWLRVVGSLKL